MSETGHPPESGASERVRFERRDFLKLVGLGLAGAASGCAAPPADKLIPYLVPPADQLPGISYWYASTCRECPAGCGVLVRTREGRAVKVEGNPAHPINRGGLCARGQASLQGLYNPDRVKSPMVKQGGSWTAISWDEALKLAGEKLGAARGQAQGVALMTANATGSLLELARQWARQAGGTHLAYEPFAYESIREANRRTFGVAAIPRLDLASARMVIAFGADFLETWVSPTEYARGFAAMRAVPESHFVAVEPRLSMTGSNADEWIAIRPGGEMALALGMAQVMLAEGLTAVPERAALLAATSAWTPAAVQHQTDVPAERVVEMARHFARLRPGLAVAGGIAAQSENSVALVAAVNLLNYVAGSIGTTVRFDRTANYDGVARFEDVQQLIAAMGEGRVGALVVHEANPVYALPPWAGFAAAMDKVPFKVSLSGVLDETAERCDLLLPDTHALESLGDAEPARGVYALIQPSMQKLPMFDARPAGDTLIGLARAGGFAAALPETWADFLMRRWGPMHSRFGAGRDFDSFWNDALRTGGVWEEVPAMTVRWAGTPAFAAPELKGGGDVTLVLYPSPALYDGRGADKPWLQELPDPVTKAVWGSWAEIHPETAARLGVRNGDPLKVETEAGALELPAYLYGGVRKDVVAVPLGQGHTALGRHAAGSGANPLRLLPEAQDAASGAIAYLSAKARLSRGSAATQLVRTQRNTDQADRRMAQVIPVAALLGGGHDPGHGAARHHEPHPTQTRPGKHTEPLERPADERTPAHAVTAYEPEEKVRGPRQTPVDQGMYGVAKHRWALAIDLQSCTGCSACIVACNAENNIPTVGPEQIKRGREMHWIRIERFEERVGDGHSDVRHMPMMCQHCGDAPCETVCPVYATYHNPEGLNAQVYNRCVGTRYCSNNCPYKVRAFNFFDYAAPEKETFAFPEPMNWQLNPDVTVRSKGVMEKCTMCVQRILEAKGNALDEGRAPRDGEFTTACAQTCPTEAIVFGDLMDPGSRVSKLSHGPRRYWALNELNTKPGVTYLKKLDRSGEHHG